LLRVLGDPLLNDCPHLVGHLEVAVRRHGVLDPLMRPLEVVVAVNPEAEAIPEIVDRSRNHPTQELLFQMLPERLHLAQCLRVMGPGHDLVNPFPDQFLLEGTLPTPGEELSSLIAQDFLRMPVLADGIPKHFQDLGAPLRGKEAPSHDVAGMIVQEGDQIHLLALGHGPHRDVDLPELVGFRSLEASDHLRTLPLLGLGRDEFSLFQGLGDLVLRDGEEFRPAQPLGDPGHAEPAEGLLGLDDLLGDLFLGGRRFRWYPFPGFSLEACLALCFVDPNPVVDRGGSNSVDLGDQIGRASCRERVLRLV